MTTEIRDFSEELPVKKTENTLEVESETAKSELNLLEEINTKIMDLNEFITEKEDSENANRVEFETYIRKYIDTQLNPQEMTETDGSMLSILGKIQSNTTPPETIIEQETAGYYADLALIVLVLGIIPVAILWKLLSLIFNTLFRHIG